MTNIPGLIFVGLRILLAAALYAFLGWSLYLLWQDLRSQNEQQSRMLIPNVLLQIDPLPGLPENLRYSLPQIYIGRDPSNDCCLPNETISARHARLIFQANQWWVEDLNSRNGTFLNESPVDLPIVLTSGDQIRCGEVHIVVTIESD